MKKLFLINAAMAFVLLGASAAYAQMNDNSQTTVREETTTAPDGQQTTTREETTTNPDGSTVREVHHWVRGQTLPQEYTTSQYRVTNWTEYHLHQPPVGYHWVHAGNNYVLVNDGGVITEIY